MLNQVLGPMLAKFHPKSAQNFVLIFFILLSLIVPQVLQKKKLKRAGKAEILSLIVPQVLQKKKLKRAGKAESHFSKDKDTDYLFTLISNR